MQKHWIGEKRGAWINFALHDSAAAEGSGGGGGGPVPAGASAAAPTQIRVFTTRPDTLYGVTYLAVSPTHSIAAHVRDERARAALDSLVASARARAEVQTQPTAADAGGSAELSRKGGLAPATSAPGLGSPWPHLHRDWVQVLT